MLLLNYILASIVAYSGLVLGMILIFMGPEEKKPGLRYLKIMQDIVIVLILFFLFYYGANIYFACFLAAAFFFSKLMNKTNQHIVYILLAVIFYLSSKSTDFFITESLLIFIYGMPTASLMTDEKNKLKSAARIFKYSHFIVIPVLLLFLF